MRKSARVSLETSNSHYERWDCARFFLFSAIFVLQGLKFCVGLGKNVFLPLELLVKSSLQLNKNFIFYMTCLDHKRKCRTKLENMLICTLHENGGSTGLI